jgi:MFS family permease
MEPTDIDGRAAWARLALSLLVAVIGSVGAWAIIVLMPSVEDEFATDRAGASLPYTLTMLGYAAGNVVVGLAVDRWGLSRALAASAVLSALAFVAAAQAPGILALAAVQAVVGFGAAAAFGPLIADVSQWFDRRRGIAIAIAASGNYAAGAVWPLILSPVIAEWSWRGACLMLAGVMLLVLLPLSQLLRGSPRRATQARAPDRAVMPPGLLQGLLIVAGFACCVAMSMPQVHIVALCADLGFGPAIGAGMLSIMLAGGVASRLFFGLVGDRLGGLNTALIGASLQCLALFLYLPAGGLVSLYVVSLVFGLSQGGIVPSYALIVRRFLPAREAGARVGLVMMATTVGMAAGGWLTGEIRDWTGSYQAAFINGIGWNILNLAVLWYVFYRSRPGGSPVPA